jgi:hypothetical protein
MRTTPLLWSSPRRGGITLQDDPNTYNVSIGALAEWPQALGTTIENGVRYRRKGFYLTVDVYRA